MSSDQKHNGSHSSIPAGKQNNTAIPGFGSSSGNNSSGDLMTLLVQNVQDYAIFMIDPNGFIVEWTDGAERVTGYRADEIVGKNFSLFYTSEEIASGQPARELAEAAATGRIEKEGWRIIKNGKKRLINEIATAIRDQKGTLLGFAKISRDITERKLTEEALRHSEERLKIVMESILDHAIIITDPQNIIVSWNTGASNLFGYSTQEAVGKPGDIIFTEQDRALGQPHQEIQTALTGGHATDERYHVRKDGSLLFVSGALYPLYTNSRQLMGFVKIARDLTERKVYEQNLSTANRRKDEFIAMLGHELRNPLAPVQNSLYILSMTHATDATMMPLVELMLRQINHMVVMIDDLLDVSRLSQGKIKLRMERLDLTTIIDQSAGNFRAVNGTSRSISVSIPDGPLFVMGDESRLTQVINNIVSNAVKYTAEGGHIRILAGQTESEIIMRIKDNGIGIASYNLSDIFESFVQIEATIDRSMGGLGLGLAVVKKLVELHGGTIYAESEGLGRGSEFIIHLPRIK